MILARIQISTGIRIVDDRRAYRAAEAIKKLNAELVRYWEEKRAGDRPINTVTSVEALAFR